MRVRTKRRIAIAIGCLCLFAAWGFCGGIERELVSLKHGATLGTIHLLISAAAFYKSGALKWRD